MNIKIKIILSIWIATLIKPGVALSDECVPGPFPGALDGTVALCQQWDEQEQLDFWFRPQGSLIIPYDWFLVLEQANNENLFRDRENIDRYGYIPQAPVAGVNPDGLPIGFTRDSPRRIRPYSRISDEWLGMTCAACHTALIEHQAARMLVDGAPAMSDFEQFIEGLSASLAATQAPGAKQDRFVAALFELRGAKPTRRRIRTELARLAEVERIRREWNARNRSADAEHRYGFGRLDAIGAILNEVTSTPIDEPSNYLPANAPVSYPYLWDTPSYDRV